MIEFQFQDLDQRRGRQIRIQHSGKSLTFQDVAERWEADVGFCEVFNKLLAEMPYEAFRWELPGVSNASWQQPFECVVIESLELRRSASSSAFEEYFVSDQRVVTFTNLRGDATLVVPCPVAEAEAYPHLAAFVRNAPTVQQQLFWQTVGSTLKHRISGKPVWLSTAGAGVPWLHVRLDDRPKYYTYNDYRKTLG